MKTLLFISLLTLSSLCPIAWSSAAHADDDSPVNTMWGWGNSKDDDAAAKEDARKKKEQDAKDAADRAAAAAASSDSQ